MDFSESRRPVPLTQEPCKKVGVNLVPRRSFFSADSSSLNIFIQTLLWGSTVRLTFQEGLTNDECTDEPSTHRPAAESWGCKEDMQAGIQIHVCLSVKLYT